MVHGHKGLDESDRYSGEHSWEIYSTAGSLEDSHSDRHGNTKRVTFSPQTRHSSDRLKINQSEMM